MIVDSMSDEDIIQELRKDEAGVFAKMKAQLLMDYRGGFLKSFHSFPICYTREIVSARRNRFIALFYLEGKANGKGTMSVTNMESYHLAVHFREGKGYFAYTWDENHPHRLGKFVPHFFKRYAERVGVPGNPLDVIKHYLKKNRRCLGLLAVYRNKRFTAFVMETGISLGVMNGGVTNNLTFVSYDMLFDNQKAWHGLMLKNLHTRLQLDNMSLDAKERRRVWKDFVADSALDDEVYDDFWRLFARYHLKRDVTVTRGSLPDVGMWDVFVLCDKEPAPRED